MTCKDIDGRVIFTHRNVDIDAVLAIAAFQYNRPDWRRATINIVYANWAEIENVRYEVAIDLQAGGKGIKGELVGDSRHSAFKMIVDTYGDKMHRKVLNPLTTVVDAHEVSGDAYGTILEGVDGRATRAIESSSIMAVYRALRTTAERGPEGDMDLCDAFLDVYKGLLEVYQTPIERRDLVTAAERLDDLLAVLAWQWYNKGWRNMPMTFVAKAYTEVPASEAIVRMAENSRDIAGTIVERLSFKQVLERVQNPAERAYFGPISEALDAYLNFGCRSDVSPSGLADRRQKLVMETDILTIFLALRFVWKNEERSANDWYGLWERIFRGLRKNEENRYLAERIVEKAVSGAHDTGITFVGDQVVILDGVNNPVVKNVLFDDYGVRAIVYINGNRMGAMRRNHETVRMDGPRMLALVDAAGESYNESGEAGVNGKWFRHSSGFLFCWGTKKASVPHASAVDAFDLARAVVDTFENAKVP